MIAAESRRSMDEPVAIITGAGRGIGRAVALALGRAGYRLVLASRTSHELKATADLVKCESLIVRADVASAADVEAVVRAATEKFGRIDAAIHCAGLAPVRSIADMSPEQWRTTLDTNLSSAFYLCKAAWPAFERQRQGVIVLISSQAARDPFPGFAAYGAAKAGLNLFALAAAREGHPLGIRVHVIAPAAVETTMFRGILSHEQFPTGLALQPDDVAESVAQCVLGDLRYTSGEVIYMHKVI
jgi:3-oxoacyl-[acyl-carrier protein] reductase